MNLAEVHDFLINEIGWLVIQNAKGCEKYKNEQKCSNRKKLGRLFYMITEDSSSDDDINKIMLNGIVRNNDRGASFFDNMMNNLISHHMKMQMEYCEKLVTNSIILGIALEAKMCDVSDKITSINEIEEKVQQEYSSLYDKRYSKLQDMLLKICTKINIRVNKSMNCGEIIAIVLADCLINMEIDDNSKKKGYVGAKKSRELKEKQSELRVLVADFIKESSINVYDQYFVCIWEKYHQVQPRDRDGSLLIDMIDIFVMPDVRDEYNSIIKEPFNGRWKRQFLYAKSGIGKSFLLKSILVASVVDYIFLHHRDLMSENELVSYENGLYRQITNCYFGDNFQGIIPVYIEAKKYNGLRDSETLNQEDSFDILKMSDYYEKVNSLVIHNEIKKENIIFLIDSLDEIEERKSNFFNISLDSLIQRFDSSHFIITSRFSGRDIYIDKVNTIKLMGFDDNAISDYLSKCSFLEEERRRALFDFVKENEYAFELAQNPFMLTTMLDVKNLSLKKCLDEITNAIIVRRFKQQLLSMTIDEIRAVLNYLAFCAIVLNELGNCFRKGDMANKIREARDFGLIIVSGESTDVSDEQIALFMNGLSCQSGILNVTNQSGKSTFVFQDELVMCYLAAEFLYNLSIANDKYLSSEYVFRIQSNNTKEKNLYELTSFFERITNQNILPIQESFFKALNMTILSDSKVLGNTLINYLLIKGFLTTDESLLNRIKKCLLDYLNKKYGDSQVFNRKEDEEAVRLIIERLLSV